jgi:hypothetical protein
MPPHMQVIKSRPIRLTDRGWWYLAFTLLVTLPLLLVLVSLDPIYDWYLARFVAPELERTLGFSGGAVTVTQSDSTYLWYGIRSVAPGGIFDRAGVRAGDMPIGFAHGVRSGFLGLLHQSRGQTITLRFAIQHRNSGGRWPEKRVSVTVPAKPAGAVHHLF